MSLFMDVHNIDGGVSAEDVAGAHMKDLETQGKYGVSYLRYWVDEEDGKIFVDNLNFGGTAEQLGIDFDWEVAELEVSANRLRKEIFYVPAFLLLAGVAFIQRRRKLALEAQGVAA